MIVHHSKTSNARQTLNYVLEKEGADLLFTNMGSGSDPIELANEMQKSWSTNRRIKYPIYHASLSLHGKNNEYFDSITWCRVAQFFLDEMGYSNVPYVVVRHTDTSNDHIHIVAGRCDLQTNRCIKDSWDHIKARQIARTLEQRYELTPTPDAWSRNKNQDSGTQDYSRNNILNELKDHIDRVCCRPVTLTQFKAELSQLGVILHLKTVGNQYKLTLAATYFYKQEKITGSQLGKNYTLQGLSKRKEKRLILEDNQPQQL